MTFITDSMKQEFQRFSDALITEHAKSCKLIYPGIWNACDNCVTDPITGRSSRWRNGGPVKFLVGLCPVCNGTGKRFDEQTEIVSLMCAWEPKSFFQPIPGLNIRLPAGSYVQTKGFLTLLPKVERCEFMEFQVNIEGVAKRRFKLFAEPGDNANILQGRYFVATWERV